MTAAEERELLRRLNELVARLDRIGDRLEEREQCTPARPVLTLVEGGERDA